MAAMWSRQLRPWPSWCFIIRIAATLENVRVAIVINLFELLYRFTTVIMSCDGYCFE